MRRSGILDRVWLAVSLILQCALAAPPADDWSQVDADGTTTQGTFKNGERSGRWTVTTNAGTITTTEWKGDEPAPAKGKGMTIDEAIVVVRKLITARGWPANADVIEDSTHLGNWKRVFALRGDTNQTLRALVGPDGDVIVRDEPMRATQLVKLLQEKVPKHRIADVAIMSAKDSDGVGQALDGDSQGLPGEMVSVLHAPRVETDESGARFVFFARLQNGGWTRLAVGLDGDQPIRLVSALPPGAIPNLRSHTVPVAPPGGGTAPR